MGIVRVSHVGGRTGEFSPEDQEKRIRDECKREGFRVADVIRELDVSGRTPLERRHGLRTAVELVETGRAEVIVCAPAKQSSHLALRASFRLIEGLSLF